jgi:hypothetical protein
MQYFITNWHTVWIGQRASLCYIAQSDLGQQCFLGATFWYITLHGGHKDGVDHSEFIVSWESLKTTCGLEASVGLGGDSLGLLSLVLMRVTNVPPGCATINSCISSGDVLRVIEPILKDKKLHCTCRWFEVSPNIRLDTTKVSKLFESNQKCAHTLEPLGSNALIRVVPYSQH